MSASAGPSKRAKSSSAMDLVWGRQGGRRLHVKSDFEEAEAFAASVESGAVVRVQCGCTIWFVAKRDVGDICRHCAMPLRAIKKPRAAKISAKKEPGGVTSAPGSGARPQGGLTQ